MKTIIRNFTSIFRKFVTANLLNLLGLSLAFASFFVIMTQVNFDLGYNKSITEHENLFRMTAASPCGRTPGFSFATRHGL